MCLLRIVFLIVPAPLELLLHYMKIHHISANLVLIVLAVTMSQPNRPAVVAANPAPRRVQCAIVVGEPSRRQFIGGKRLGLDTDIECWVIFMPKTTVENWFGFSIQVPLSADTEELGLGKWHSCTYSIFIV